MKRLFGPDDDSIGRIDDQLAHLRTIGNPVFGVSPVLTRDQMSLLVETAFWASLRSEEGRATHVLLVVATLGKLPNTIAFAATVPYDESHVAKLAPAVPWGGCLVVSEVDGELRICGSGGSRTYPALDAFTLETFEPGIVRVGIGPLRPFAVLDGRLNPLIEGTRIDLPHFLQKVLRKAAPPWLVSDMCRGCVRYSNHIGGNSRQQG